MSSQADRGGGLAARWGSMPRAMKWSLMAALGVGLYFGVVEPALGAMARWNSRADLKEDELIKFDNERRSRQAMDEQATLGVSRFGIVEAPGEAGERSQVFNQKVSSILVANGAKRSTTNAREVALPSNSALVRDLGSEYTVQRLVSDIQFDGEPEQVAKIISEMESSPEVSSVSRVDIRQIAGETEGGRLVHASISIEAWQFKKKVRNK